MREMSVCKTRHPSVYNNILYRFFIYRCGNCGAVSGSLQGSLDLKSISSKNCKENLILDETRTSDTHIR